MAALITPSLLASLSPEELRRSLDEIAFAIGEIEHVLDLAAHEHEGWQSELRADRERAIHLHAYGCSLLGGSSH